MSTTTASTHETTSPSCASTVTASTVTASTVTASTVVRVPVRVAYDELRHPERFPAFLEGVRSVLPTGPGRLRWELDRSGRPGFDSEVVASVPGERVAWRTSGAGALEHDGELVLEPTGPSETTVTVRLEARPRSLRQRLATRLGLVRRRLDAGLRGFRSLVEQRPTGVELNGRYDPYG